MGMYDNGWFTVLGSNRSPFINDVFDMYHKSYQKIGTHISSPKELFDKYPIWEICFKDSKPIAFMTKEKTKYGIKDTLYGSDRSLAGIQALSEGMQSSLERPFHYSELSGTPKKLMEKMKIPAVQVERAIEILKNMGKDPLKVDEKTYMRILRNIGPIEKSMYGHPSSSPFTEEFTKALSKRKIKFS
jgi:hypothetical protein